MIGINLLGLLTPPPSAEKQKESKSQSSSTSSSSSSSSSKAEKRKKRRREKSKKSDQAEKKKKEDENLPTSSDQDVQASQLGKMAKERAQAKTAEGLRVPRDPKDLQLVLTLHNVPFTSADLADAKRYNCILFQDNKKPLGLGLRS